MTPDGQNSSSAVVGRTKEYYDSPDADEFYYRVWGGEDIHIGMYLHSSDSIAEASERTVIHMASKIKRFLPGTQVLDLGAGYGGSARYLARVKGYRVVCLNLSEAQNKRNREMNLEQGQSVLVDVVDGNFEDPPFPDASFDVVWSQDAILHSGNRRKVFQEVDRMLKPGGEFLFSDPMQTESADPETIAPVLERIHLQSLGSPETYLSYANDFDWETVDIELLDTQLVAHYTQVLQTLGSRQSEIAKWCSSEYIERMKSGLRLWVDAGVEKSLTWGFLHFRKPE